MKDKFIWGAIYGILADIPKEIVDFALYFSGFSKFYCWMIPGGIVLRPKYIYSVHGIILGGLNDFIVAGALGVGLTYFLTLMEKRYLFLKGMSYSLGIWLFFCMMIVARVSNWLRFYDPPFAYQTFLVHQIWGLVATWLIVKNLVKEKW
jgi:hypothetical protein